MEKETNDFTFDSLKDIKYTGKQSCIMMQNKVSKETIRAIFFYWQTLCIIICYFTIQYPKYTLSYIFVKSGTFSIMLNIALNFI